MSRVASLARQVHFTVVAMPYDVFFFYLDGLGTAGGAHFPFVYTRLHTATGAGFIPGYRGDDTVAEQENGIVIESDMLGDLHTVG